MTYDQHTLAPLITRWAMEGRDHAGILFIDEKSIAPEDAGGKVRALLSLWEQRKNLDWTNVVSFLKLDP